MSGLANWFEPRGVISERLDAAINEQDQLDARVTTLVRILAEKGVLTQDEIARIADAARAARQNDD